MHNPCLSIREVKMIVRNAGIFCKNRFFRYLSTLPLNANESISPEKLNPENNENKKNELKHPDYFNVHKLFSIKDLFNAKVHYGHKISSLNDKMKPFIFGSRLDHIVFDLDITAYHLREALNFTAHIAYLGGIILFISRNPRVTLLVEDTAKKCGEYAVTREWIVGAFTGSTSIFGKTIRLPDLCILLNTTEENGNEHLAVKDSAKMCIPTVGIVDSNCNPNLITYPVPGNDDSYSSIALYCKVFSEAILLGKKERLSHTQNNSKDSSISS